MARYLIEIVVLALAFWALVQLLRTMVGLDRKSRAEQKVIRLRAAMELICQAQSELGPGIAAQALEETK